MKKILYTLGLFCSIFLSSCNESTEIEIPEATPTIENEGADIEFTLDDLKLPSKKGVCLELGEDVRETNLGKIEQLNAGWNHSWGLEFVEGLPEGTEFIPMFSDKGSVTTNNLAYLKQEIQNGRCKRVLGFNEPDGEKQVKITVEQALELWPQLQALGVPLGSPAVFNATNLEWLDQFMSECTIRGYRVDFICVHFYGSVDVEAFKEVMQGVIDKYQKPILITEFAVADWNSGQVSGNPYSAEEVMAFMEGVLPWLEDNDNVLGYAWSHAAINNISAEAEALYDMNNNLTDLGEYYMNFTPETGGDGGDGGDSGEEVPAGDNLVQNPGFENDKENWTSSGTIETENAISGSKTLKLTGGAWASNQQIISTPVEPGATYKFGCTGRVDGGKLQIFIRKPNDNSVKYTTPGDAAISSTENTKVSHTVTIPDGVTQVEIIFNKTAAQAVYVDDVYFIKVTE